MYEEIEEGSVFTGFLKEGFKKSMVDFWMLEEFFDTREEAYEYYYTKGFDLLCAKYDVELTFNADTKNTCFEAIDNNYVIPINLINVYKFKETSNAD